MSARAPKGKEGEHIWVSVGPDRVKIYYQWEPDIYWYLHGVRAIRTGEPWLGIHTYMLEMEFDVTTERARTAFIRKVKAATCLGNHREGKPVGRREFRRGQE